MKKKSSISRRRKVRGVTSYLAGQLNTASKALSGTKWTLEGIERVKVWMNCIHSCYQSLEFGLWSESRDADSRFLGCGSTGAKFKKGAGFNPAVKLLVPFSALTVGV
jgi:hypothetical protein